jgi:hypothetical protein
MRFVPIKSVDRQAILAWHVCARGGRKNARRCSIGSAVCSPNTG